ncbi:hypothetical protein V2S66_15270 [Streptomyces sp. V4-01]|uniref:Uncharacterized protein n=1 Tax=Actinacidiphila polyblastidii TaxID=3110430 RepID=A0ABU7PBZ3_9ACTN|nr:hypothetical protein [Streptomyces sp. V4-01]
MDNHAVTTDFPAAQGGSAAPDDAVARAEAVRAARRRVAILAGMTVGAVAVATLGDAPTTVSSIIL